MTRRRAPARVDDPVTRYAESVVAGRTVTGRPVRLACERHLNDVRTAKQRGLVWDPTRAEHALTFFREFLVLPDGPNAGEPFVLRSWALFTVGSLHGWWTSEGHRRFTMAYVETGKGQAKTPVGCGLAIYAMIAEGMKGAQCFIAARARVQANDSFKDVERILGPALRERLELFEHNVDDPQTQGFIRPVSSEARTLEGGRVYFALLDEVALHKNAEVVKAMQRGTKGNRDALLFCITNSGEDRESIAWGLHEKGLKVLEGVLDDDEFFAYICALDPCEKCQGEGHQEPQDGCPDCDDWHDEKVWTKTSPLLGITIPLAYVRKEVRGAVDIPSTESSVRRFNFCSWLRSERRWFTPDQWGACAAMPDELRGRPAILGVDLSSTRDLSSAVLIAPTADYYAHVTVDSEGHVVISDTGGYLDVLCWTWCPETMVREQTQRGHPYDAWVRLGALIATPGNTIDRRAIRRHVVSLREQGYWIEEVAYDTAFAHEFAQDLQDQHGFRVVPVAQDFRTMTTPCQLLETLVARRQLRHGGAPVLRFAAANVLLDMDNGGRVRPNKKKSEPQGKIDPISALVTALSRINMLQGLSMGSAAPIVGAPRVTATEMPW
jgi:phage terminase large subunit-like protein